MSDKPLLFIINYHKGELNVVYTYISILKHVDYPVKVIYLTRNGRHLYPHGDLLMNSLSINYLNFGKLATEVDITDLDEYLEELQPIGASVDVGSPEWLAQYFDQQKIPLYHHLHAFTTYPWSNKYLAIPQASPSKLLVAKVILHETTSIKRFRWLGYASTAVTGWTCMHSTVLNKTLKNKKLQEKKYVIIYSYEFRSDFFPLEDWLFAHKVVIEVASMLNLSVCIRSHPSQGNNQLVALKQVTDIQIDDISNDNVFDASAYNGIHCGIMTSGPVLAHLRGMPACAIYPVRKGCHRPEHCIIPGLPVDIFTELGMKSLSYYENINHYNIKRLLLESVDNAGKNYMMSSVELDTSLEHNLARAYEISSHD